MNPQISPASMWRALFELNDKIRIPSDEEEQNEEKEILTLSQRRIFLYFFVLDFEPPTVKGISRFAHITDGAVTQEIDRYEGKGLIQRVRRKSDRNHTRLELTEAGQAFKQAVQKANLERYNRYIKLRNAEEHGIFHRILVQLAAFLKNNLPTIQREYFGSELINFTIRLPLENCPPYEHLENWQLLARIFSHLLASIFPFLGTKMKLSIGKKRIFLALLFARTSRISYQNIVSQYQFSSSSLSVSAAALERDGLVERKISALDKRVSYLLLTEEGKRFKHQIIEYYNCVMSRFWAAAGSEDRKVFLAELAKRQKKVRSSQSMLFANHKV